MISAQRKPTRLRALNSPTKTKGQLRGRDLQDRIKRVIEELVASARSGGQKYVYNASQVSRLVPTTRRSLDKQAKIVASLLNKLNVGRRTVAGKATMRELRDQTAYLRGEIDRRDRVIKQLRMAHVSIYDCFLASTFDGHQLLRAIERQADEAAVDEAGKCSLCGASIQRSSDAESRRDRQPSESISGDCTGP